MARAFMASGQFVDHGSAASLDNLAQTAGGFGVYVWAKYMGGGSRHVISKYSGGAPGWVIKGHNVPGEGTLELDISRATTSALATSVAGVLPPGRWSFIAFDFDSAASPTIRVFVGGPLAANTVAEVSYTTQTSGTGTPSSDAAAKLYVGNIEAATTLPFSSDIQRGGVIAGSRPGASGFETIRLASLPTATNNPTQAEWIAACAAVGTHKLLFDYQDGSVADLSGTGNNGTATGATASELLNKLDLYEGQGAAGRIQGQAVSRSSLY